MTGRSPLLILATGNSHKVQEIRDILLPLIPGLAADQIASAAQYSIPEVVEDALTFEENALKKARAVASHTGVMALADDSGLAVDAMHGAPGIFSARWSGRHGDDRANLELLLAQIADVPTIARTASFICAAALVDPRGQEVVVRGTMPGSMATRPAGKGGFGYDPAFVPEGFSVTAAELSADQKNAISHRSKALLKMAPIIADRLGLV